MQNLVTKITKTERLKHYREVDSIHNYKKLSLWSMVVDEALNTLESGGFEVQGYADDISILIREKFENSVG